MKEIDEPFISRMSPPIVVAEGEMVNVSEINDTEIPGKQINDTDHNAVKV